MANTISKVPGNAHFHQEVSLVEMNGMKYVGLVPLSPKFEMKINAN
jgi:hypothetical protein